MTRAKRITPAAGDAAAVPTPAPAHARRRCWAVGLALLLVTLAVYIPAMRAGYIWDDDDYVTENRTLRTPEGLRRIWFEVGAVPQYYPLVHTTFWLEYRLWQLRPAGYHISNILLHALGAILLWRLLARLKVPGALLAAAIFALHPVHVESVAWITERKNVLSGVMYLAAALCYLRFRPLDDRTPGQTPDQSPASPAAVQPPVHQHWVWYGLALLFFIGALLSKSVTASLPAAILLVTWWKHGRLRLADLWPLLPFFAVGIAAGLHTAHLERVLVGATGDEFTLGFVERTLVAGRAVWFYAGKLVWPWPLVFIYPRWQIDASAWWQHAFPIAAIALLATLFLLRRRIGRGPLVAILFFGGTLFPALGFFNVFPMRYSFVADHFQYLASIGMITLLAAAAATLLPRVIADGRIRIALAAAVLAVLAGVTWAQLRVYQNAESLWRATVARNPDWMPHANLAQEMLRQGNDDEALRLINRSLELYPRNEFAWNTRGIIFMNQRRFSDARDAFERALGVNSDYHLAALNAAQACAALGDTAAAGAHYQRVAAHETHAHAPDAQRGLAQLALQTGDLPTARAHLEQAVAAGADNARTWLLLGQVTAELGDFERATTALTRAAELMPDNADPLINLGRIMLMTNRAPQAIAYYERALAVDRGSVDALGELAMALAQSGQPARAVVYLERALQLQPQRGDLRAALEQVRAMQRQQPR